MIISESKLEDSDTYLLDFREWISKGLQKKHPDIVKAIKIFNLSKKTRQNN